MTMICKRFKSLPEHRPGCVTVISNSRTSPHGDHNARPIPPPKRKTKAEEKMSRFAQLNSFVALVALLGLLSASNVGATRSRFMSIPFVTQAAHVGDAPNISTAPDIPVNYARVMLSVLSPPVPSDVLVMGQTSACFECDLLPVGANPDPSWYVDVPSPFSFNMAVISGNKTVAFSHWFGERGVYIVVVDLTTSSVDISTIEEPENIYIPIVVALGASLILLAVLHYGPSFAARLLFSSDSSSENINNSERSRFLEDPNKDGMSMNGKVVRGKMRYTSLDTMRGLSLSIMVFVNQGGGWYWWLNHSFWNGLTVADLVFPWFVFMMGTSLAIVLRSSARRGEQLGTIFQRSLRRSVILFCFGLLVAMPNYPTSDPRTTDLATLRIPGVLQRFAVSYVVVVIIAYALPPHEAAAPEYDPYDVESSLLAWIRSLWQHDIMHYRAQWLVVLLIQSAWLLLTFCLPVPGCPTGYIGPGGLSDHGKYFNCTGGAARYIDYEVLGVSHIYQHGTFQAVYHPTVHHDPEGTLGYLTSIALCFYGLMAGRILLNNAPSHASVMKRLYFYGSILCLVAGGLCGFSQNNGVIPLCKNLWSLSFILCMGGFAMILLATLHYVIDIKHWWSGSPFVYPGMNSIAVYMISELLGCFFPLSFNPPGSSHAWELTRNLTAVGSLMILAYWFDHVKFYLAV